ncbi:MAG: hypothetical protein WCS15_08470 [Prevotella sp.]
MKFEHLELGKEMKPEGNWNRNYSRKTFMSIDKRLILWVFLLFSLSISAQDLYQSKYGDQEFKERISYYRKDVKNFDDFYSNLIADFETKNFAAIASMIRYPIKVNVKGKKVKVHNASEFIQIAGSFMDQNFIDKVLSEKQSLSYLSGGVVLGKGQLWLNTEPINGVETWLVIAINH